VSADPWSGGSVRAAERTLQILMLFTQESHPEWSLDDIARGASLPKSTAHRLLHTLGQQGFVQAGGQPGTYRLGLRAAVLGAAAIRDRRPRQHVHELLRQAVEEVGETVGLAALDGTVVVSVDKVRSPRPLQWNPGIGATMPAHQSAAGKVFLADLSEEELRHRYAGVAELPRATANTVGSVDELLERLHVVRQQGYAVDAEELEDGLRCVSVPVRGPSGRLVYALTMSAPAQRLELTAVQRFAGALTRIATAMGVHAELDEDAR
jgi:DNA-binding IclR family transcriptional regulator